MPHTLAHNGAAHNADGEQIYPDRVRYTQGEGRGKCSGCGALSKVLPNGASRRRWFDWHKEHAPEPETYPETELQFTRSLAKFFWASLAVNGTRKYLENHYPDVRIRADYDTTLIYLSGPDPKNVSAAVASVLELWEDAAKEFYWWRKSDPVYRSLQHDIKSNRRASYKLTKDFFINYCAKR